MSNYLGRGLEQVDNISKLDNITFNGGTTYALTKDSSAFTPISSNAILISISGVIQQGNFSVDGTNIVFNTAVASSESCDFIMHYGTGVAFTPADSSVTKDKANFISTSSSSGLQIKGDGTTDGTLQLNCSQNTHGVKIKSPAHSASQSYTLTLPTTAPATDKIMQTDSSGNLSFVDKPSGTHELLLTVNASGASTVELNGTAYFKTDYHHFVVYFQNVDLSTNSSFLDVQCGVSSGFITSNGYGSARYGRRTNGDNNSSDLGTGDYVYTQFSLNNGAAYFDGDENIQGELRIWNAFDSHYKVITSKIMYGLQDDIGILDLGGHFKQNGNLTAIRFITPDSATISGTFRLYGVK